MWRQILLNDWMFHALNVGSIFILVGLGGFLMYWIPLWIERLGKHSNQS